MDKCWFLLLVETYTNSVSNCILEGYTKGITIDRHMDLRVFILSIIILYKHNRDKIFW